MRYLSRLSRNVLSIPVILRFLHSREIGGAYGIGARKKLGLLVRFWRNTRRVETLSDVREHMELAAAILRVPPSVKGDVVECGCYVGGSSVNLSLACAMVGRRLLICDSFEGLPEPEEHDREHLAVHVGHVDTYYKGRFAASLGLVKSNLERYGNLEVCDFRVGFFDKTMAGLDRDVVMAFLDVDLIDSLKPCLRGIWPRLAQGCRVYVHEARNIPLVALFFDASWWRQTLGQDAPGFVGSGVGLPLAVATHWGSELGYAQKAAAPEIAAAPSAPTAASAARPGVEPAPLEQPQPAGG
ncbi:TylF/MycF/NovP-related O-methyltransferase [Marinimicrococcus flavescens]|uniref:Macrocin O-methyltransferase n=1 Tax=Marinimicrococcus flavescens TaxID=3031815 RepID=A0AAP3XQG5_9PROT|nr:macrocin O-methyltransferase [Marinimicrococcus flavescens]